MKIYPDILTACDKKCKDKNLTRQEYINILIQYNKDKIFNNYLEPRNPDKICKDQEKHYIFKGFNLFYPVEIPEICPENIQELMLQDLACKEIQLWFMSCFNRQNWRKFVSQIFS
jgi:hypothetical protein